LQRHVLEIGVTAKQQFRRADVSGVSGYVRRGQVFLQERDLRAFFQHNQHVTESHTGLRIVEDAVQRKLDGFATRNVQEDPVRPQRRVQRREFTFAGQDGFCHEPGPHEIGVFADGGIQVGKDDALLTQ